MLLSLLFLQDAPSESTIPAAANDLADLLEPPIDPNACSEADPAVLTDGGASDPDAVATLEAWAFPELTPEQEEERLGIRTDGLVIVHQGQVVYERYDRGYTAETPHLMWSVTKTLTNAMTGVAVEQGALSVDDSICDHLALETHCDITVANLLEFSSGLDWRETYAGDPPTTSTVIAMLYGAGRGDIAAYVHQTPKGAEPGTRWQYSSGDTNLLAAVVQSAMKDQEGFPFAGLFDELGMDSLVLERDEAGTIVGSSYGYATPRDMAKFGQFMLNDGCVRGERMLPVGWMERSTVMAPSLRLHAVDREAGDVNGRQIWLNRAVPELNETQPPWPDAPEDTYAAMGYWKQAILVIPSQDLVIARTGDDRDGSFEWNTLLGHAMAVIGAEAPPHPTMTASDSGELSASLSRKEDMGLLGLGTGYGAKLACSCAYVMGMEEDFCRTWIKASPDLVKVKFDPDTQSVTARALLTNTTTASWRGPREGCTLEP